MSVALIDGDSIIYILAWTNKECEDEDLIKGQVDQLVLGVLHTVNKDSYVGALGNSETRCFRYNVAKYKPYKGTRAEKQEWVIKWEKVIRDRLFEEWKFISVPGLEADDIVSIAAHHYDDYIICSPDKDLTQIPGPHFDYKKQEFSDITPEQAEYFFYYQMLVGDQTDNIAGIPGLGPKKAPLKLQGEDFLDHAVRKAYQEYFGDYYGNVIFEDLDIHITARKIATS
jgi:hypothetical protein